MTVLIRVTYLDGGVGQFWVGASAHDYHTWYVQPDETEPSSACIVLKRYPAPSATRLVIPLSQVRYYEVIREGEADEVQARYDAAPVGRRPESWRERRRRERAEAGLAGFATHFSRADNIHDRPGQHDSVDTAAGTQAASQSKPPPCPHIWTWVHVIVPGTVIGESSRILGGYERCERCRAVRKPREPEGSEPDREVPGQVADGPGLLGDLRGAEVRQATGEGD